MAKATVRRVTQACVAHIHCLLNKNVRMVGRKKAGMQCHKLMLHVVSRPSQVEQCINRLKMMEVSSALQELVDLCPKRIQR